MQVEHGSIISASGEKQVRLRVGDSCSLQCILSIHQSFPCVGTVLAAEVKPESGQGAGYTATGAKDVVMSLRKTGVYARPLGNVVYLMVTPTTSRQQCAHLVRKLFCALE